MASLANATQVESHGANEEKEEPYHDVASQAHGDTEGCPKASSLKSHLPAQPKAVQKS